MMGGGLCWLDYDGDGWLDLFVVNSYVEADVARWKAAGRPAAERALPQRAAAGSRTSAAARAPTSPLRGNGCVAADFDLDGHTDLYVTTAGYNVATDGYDALLWNDGDGTFTEGARAAGIDAYGWHAGAAVGDVNGDGLPGPLRRRLHRPQRADPGLVRRLPDEPPRRARPPVPEPRAGRERPIDASARSERSAGLEPRDARPRSRRRLHRRRPRRAPRPLRRERPRPEPAVPERALAGATGGLGFRFEERGGPRGRRRPERRAWASPPPTTPATGCPTCSSRTRAASCHAAYRSRLRRRRAVVRGRAARLRGARSARRSRAGARRGPTSTSTATSTSSLANGAIPVANLTEDAAADPGARERRDDRDGRRDSRRGRRRSAPPDRASTAAASPRPTTTTTATSTSRSTRSAAGSSCSRTTAPTGHWLEVQLDGFAPGDGRQATLPDGRTLVREVHAGSELPLLRGSRASTSGSGTRPP